MSTNDSSSGPSAASCSSQVPQAPATGAVHQLLHPPASLDNANPPQLEVNDKFEFFTVLSICGRYMFHVAHNSYVPSDFSHCWVIATYNGKIFRGLRFFVLVYSFVFYISVAFGFLVLFFLTTWAISCVKKGLWLASYGIFYFTIVLLVCCFSCSSRASCAKQYIF